MKRRAIDSLERAAVYVRDQYCYLHNRHGKMVKYAKRKINKRERREGRIEADVEAREYQTLRHDYQLDD